jgi:hypothetical protein
MAPQQNEAFVDRHRHQYTANREHIRLRRPSTLPAPSPYAFRFGLPTLPRENPTITSTGNVPMPSCDIPAFPVRNIQVEPLLHQVCHVINLPSICLESSLSHPGS